MMDIMKADNNKILSKYMSYNYFIDLIKYNRLTLVNPDLWEDKNDTMAISHYKRTCKINCLMASCFTQASETYHHWSIYGKKEGVRVVFNKKNLINTLIGDSSFVHNEVTYVKINEFNKIVCDISQLPFTKRHPYRDEKEYRIIWCGNEVKDNNSLIYHNIPYDCIDKVVIGPLVSDNRLDEMVNEISKLSHNVFEAKRTSVLYSKTWLKMVHKLQ